VAKVDKISNAEANATVAKFNVSWDCDNESLRSAPNSSTAEVIRLALARQQLLTTIRMGAERKKIERLRFLSVVKNGANRARRFNTADDLAAFLFG
jgi:hypothetical protein